MWVNKNKFELLQEKNEELEKKLGELNDKLEFLVETIYGKGVKIEEEINYESALWYCPFFRKFKLTKTTEAKKEEVKHLSQKKEGNTLKENETRLQQAKKK